MNRNNTTVHEVAQHAGVSIATVSRVTRGVGQVAPETQHRVLAAIEALGYHPHYLGRALVQQRHAALGIVFPGMSGPYYADLINGFEAEAVAARHSVHILETHLLQQSDEQVLEMALRVDGLAILGGTIADTTLQALIDAGVPIVLIARLPLPGVPTVRVEDFQSTVELTLHLLTIHNYRDIRFLGNPVGSPDIAERWEGFVEAHRQVGIQLTDLPIRVGLTQADGFRAVARLIQENDLPRALVCANDETALGAYGAAQARGIRVPDQLAITGWDDIPMARLVTPALTTVRQPIRSLGQQTAQLLLANIRGELTNASDTVLATEVLVRASCGCTYQDVPASDWSLDLGSQ